MKIFARFLLSAVLCSGWICTARTGASDAEHWVATWGASPASQEPDATKRRNGKFDFNSQTVREIVHTSIGGKTVRVRFSNAFGKTAVKIGAAHLGRERPRWFVSDGRK